MGRKTDGIVGRTEHFSARFRPHTLSLIDRMRGSLSRTRFIERLIHEEDKRRSPRTPPKGE